MSFSGFLDDVAIHSNCFCCFSAHGLGTAAMADETQAFAFSAIAMAIVGMSSATLVSIPAVRTALIWVTFGHVR